MRPRQNTLHPNEPAQRIARDAHGSPGAALILELERLSRDFDRETADNQHASRARRPTPDVSPGRSRTKTTRFKRRKKGKVGRVIDYCLEQVGLRSVVPVQPKREPTDATPVAPPRYPSPSLAPGHPLSM